MPVHQAASKTPPTTTTANGQTLNGHVTSHRKRSPATADSIAAVSTKADPSRLSSSSTKTASVLKTPPSVANGSINAKHNSSSSSSNATQQQQQSSVRSHHKSPRQSTTTSDNNLKNVLSVAHAVDVEKPLSAQQHNGTSAKKPGGNNVVGTDNDDDDDEFAVVEEAVNPEPLQRRRLAAATAPQRAHVGQPQLRTISSPAAAAAAVLPNMVAQIQQQQHADYASNEFDAYEDDFEEEFIDDDDDDDDELDIAHASAPVSAPPISPPLSVELKSVEPPFVEPKRDQITAKSDAPPIGVHAALASTIQPPQFVRRNDDETIDFLSASAAQQHKQHSRAVARRAAKFDTIRRLVQFDYAHFRHFTLNPAGSHARYLELFGKRNVKLAATQAPAVDEGTEQEVQTDEPERCHAWTQHPALSANEASDREDMQQTSSSSQMATSRQSNLMPSSSALHVAQFIAQASECIVKLLNESQQTRTADRVQQSNTLSLDGKSEIFTSVTLIGPEPSMSIDYTTVLCMACSEPKMDRIATCHPRLPSHQPTADSTSSSAFCVILVWNISTALVPEAVLCTQDTNSRIVCCIFHRLDPSIIIAGCADGSLECWCMQRSGTRNSFVQMSFDSKTKPVNVPLILADFSTAPLGGGRAPPPHSAPVVALDEFVDTTGAHRVGIAGVRSSCTLASLDTCSKLCLWNVLLDSSILSPVGDNMVVDNKQPAITAELLADFCITPPSLAGNVVFDAKNRVALIRLVPIGSVNILESTKVSGAVGATHFSPAPLLFTTFISYSDDCFSVRFSPYHANGAILACLIDGRLYRVDTGNNNQRRVSYNKVVDRTPRNTASTIVSFAFPAPSKSAALKSLYQRHIVACLHDVGNVTFVSLDTGQLLTTWSSPLLADAASFSVDLYSLTHTSHATIWWPDNGLIVLVGADATVVTFRFPSDDSVDGCWPDVAIDSSMSRRKASNNNNDIRCMSSYVGSDSMTLAILTSAGPIAMLKIKPTNTTK